MNIQPSGSLTKGQAALDTQKSSVAVPFKDVTPPKPAASPCCFILLKGLFVTFEHLCSV